MQYEAQHAIYIGMPSINSISKTEVQFLISVGTPTPISTWYDQIYWRWTRHKHTCNLFLVLGGYSQLTDLGMWSNISKQQVVRSCFLINELVPHITITGKQHTAPDIKVIVKFQVEAHQSLLHTTHWHFQNCCCHMCLLIILMHSFLPIQAFHA